ICSTALARAGPLWNLLKQTFPLFRTRDNSFQSITKAPSGITKNNLEKNATKDCKGGPGVMSMNKRTARNILVSGALTALIVPALNSPSFAQAQTQAQTQGQAQASKPNILFIMGDDIGWMQPGIYHRGLMVGETPNIDRIGNEGAMFVDYV